MTTRTLHQRRMHPVVLAVIALIVLIPLLMMFGCAGYRGNVTALTPTTVNSEGGGTALANALLTSVDPDGPDGPLPPAASVSITQPGEMSYAESSKASLLSQGPAFIGDIGIGGLLTISAGDTGDFVVKAATLRNIPDGDGNPKIIEVTGLEISSRKTDVITASTEKWKDFTARFNKASDDQQKIAVTFITEWAAAGKAITDSVLELALKAAGIP